MFDYISKKRVRAAEYFDELRGVWKSCQILYQTKLNSRRKQRNKIVKTYAN